GKSRSHVANSLRLLALPPRVRDMVYDSKLTAGHARAIASAPNPEVLAVRIVDGGLNVRDAEALAREATDERREAGAPRPGRPPSKDADTMALEREVAQTLGLDVDIRHKGDSGGEVRVRYRQLEQLEDICKRLKGRAA
ncbi:MAG: chromosome partitioning protein ParB, partial [Caulobacterales bacterium]|nr:chromosome partitioning protein ParB [Caulobacterales bacterium]